MARPKEGYKLANGTLVPGATSIISRWKDSGALIRWAWKQGRDGKELYESRDIAATIGTYAHDLIEASINEKPAPAAPTGLAEDDIARGHNAYKQFARWQKQTGIFVVSWEKPLVSEHYQYGGTIDSMGECDGVLTLLDWKTSAGTYPDNLLQLAAYTILWEENFPDQPIHGAHIVRFSKDFSDVEHRSFDNLDREKEQFLILRQAYENDRIIRQRV